MIKIFQVFVSGLELVSQEVSINFHIGMNFNLQSLDEVSQVNFNPSFFNRGLDFRNFNLKLFEFGDFIIE